MGLFDRLRNSVTAARTAFAEGDRNAVDPFWYQDFPFLGRSASGATVTDETAMLLSAVCACVRILAETIADSPFEIQEITRSDSKITRTLIADHPLAFILRQEVNPELSAYNWKETLMMHALLSGNDYSFIDHNMRGEVIALWPLHPKSVRTFRDKDTMKIMHEVRMQDGAKEIFPDEKILHFKNLSDDSLVGRGSLHYQREQIGAALSADQYSGIFFRNDGTPSGVLETEIKLGATLEESAAEKAEISRTWMEKTTGANRHATPVLDQGLKFTKIGLDPETAQLLETRIFNVTDISRCFRVPLVLLNQMSQNTSFGKGIEQVMIGFEAYTIRPWVKRISQQVHKKLLSPSEKKRLAITMNTDGLIRGDITAKSEAVSKLHVSGIITANEGRARFGLNPVADGDDLLIPLNFEPVGTPRSLKRTATENNLNGRALNHASN